MSGGYFNAIPMQLKKGVSVGIGLFIAFLGLQNAHIVVNSDSTLVTMVKFTKDFHTTGISALLALIGLVIISVLYIKNVKGSILLGILITLGTGISLHNLPDCMPEIPYCLSGAILTLVLFPRPLVNAFHLQLLPTSAFWILLL